MQVIDGGKLYDWLEARGLDITRLDDDGSLAVRWVPREEFAELFRQYVAELTGD